MWGSIVSCSWISNYTVNSVWFFIVPSKLTSTLENFNILMPSYTTQYHSGGFILWMASLHNTLHCRRHGWFRHCLRWDQCSLLVFFAQGHIIMGHFSGYRSSSIVFCLQVHSPGNLFYCNYVSNLYNALWSFYSSISLCTALQTPERQQQLLHQSLFF